MKKLKLLIIICLVICLIPFGINGLVILKTKNNIFEYTEVNDNYDIALILGCSVLRNGNPSLMLRDRLDKGIELYESNKVNKILISGDHSKEYSEVEVMYNYLIEHGINEEDIVIDYEGYSTSDSILNYKKEYSDKSVIIVTQKYHLYRALFIANDLSLNAIGIPAKEVSYNGQFFREVREILARNKDFVIFTILK